jgi:septal ring-binding cell division protein DamX
MNLKKNILVLLLVTILLFAFLKIRESFLDKVSAQTNSDMVNANKNIPAVDPKVVASAKAGILNVINTRPDVIETAKQVLSEPLIRATVNNLLFESGSGSGSESA